MKTKERKNGISLIVLVITIIVIIILALAVILSINKNNPIENARVAKEKNNEKVYQEELELYVANEYVNNHSYNRDTLNAFNTDKVKDIITSMSEEDEGKYIIWQGRVAKKDGDKYIELNGNKLTMLDGTLLTEPALEFAKLLEEVQKGEDEESSLKYNGGYIANIPFDGLKIVDFKNKFPNPELIETKNWDGSDISYYVYFGNDNQIWYNGNLVARVIIYGDVDNSGGINPLDPSYLRQTLNGWITNVTVGQWISADLNHDGIVNMEDETCLKKWLNKEYEMNINIYPTIPNH